MRKSHADTVWEANGEIRVSKTSHSSLSTNITHLRRVRLFLPRNLCKYMIAGTEHSASVQYTCAILSRIQALIQLVLNNTRERCHCVFSPCLFILPARAYVNAAPSQNLGPKKTYGSLPCHWLLRKNPRNKS